ncbi:MULTISPECIES: hypothetical protein [Bacillus]|uniref:hypothetical protein n=1 Tax=Bacillus TaxID=1386 RepID=UPI0001ED29DE|nr:MULTISPECIES: hypothetical protein [Bacillus cereus group]KXY69579.1 hypothetical protein AT270_27340 [Bacillus cereus]MBG9939234.1 hypothetical protein [Bacillus tropicus]MED2996220.1 hypothetical protein [Bacillus tropicus]OTY50218.1 hypothetical protein BK748_25030 [Bacillus thuringiensis serovar graciosensis]
MGIYNEHENYFINQDKTILFYDKTSPNYLIEQSKNILEHGFIPELSKDPFDKIPLTSKSIHSSQINATDFLTLTLRSARDYPKGITNSLWNELLLICRKLVAYFFHSNMDIPILYNSYGIEIDLDRIMIAKPLNTIFKNEILLYISLPNKYLKHSSENIQLMKYTSYKLLDSGLQDAKMETHWSQFITSGLNLNTLCEFLTVIGFEITNISEKTVIPTSIEQKIRNYLNYIFNTNNTYITNQIKRKSYILKSVSSNYIYDKYAYAIYQLTTEYKLIVKNNLQNILTKINTAFKQEILFQQHFGNIKLEIPQQYIVEADNLCIIRTPDPIVSKEYHSIQIMI